MTPDSVRYNLRCAGNVTRYHTWPTITKQTIADHTFHVLRLLRQLYPEIVGVNVIDYVIWHDLAEISTGDLPYPIKKDNPKLAELIKQIESDWYARFSMDDLAVDEEDIHAVKICDLVEMAEFAMHEFRLGNCFAAPIYKRVAEALRQMGIPKSVEDYIERIGI